VKEELVWNWKPQFDYMCLRCPSDEFEHFPFKFGVPQGMLKTVCGTGGFWGFKTDGLATCPRCLIARMVEENPGHLDGLIVGRDPEFPIVYNLIHALWICAPQIPFLKTTNVFYATLPDLLACETTNEAQELFDSLKTMLALADGGKNQELAQ